MTLFRVQATGWRQNYSMVSAPICRLFRWFQSAVVLKNRYVMELVTNVSGRQKMLKTSSITFFIIFV